MGNDYLNCTKTPNEPSSIQTLKYIKFPEEHIHTERIDEDIKIFPFPGQLTKNYHYFQHLRLNRQKFEDCYFQEQDEQTLGSPQFRALFGEVCWFRITSMFNKNQHYDHNIRLSSEYYSIEKNINCALYEILERLNHIPSLFAKIIPAERILNQGFTVVKLPLYGAHANPTEIVLDDYIPMKKRKLTKKEELMLLDLKFEKKQNNQTNDNQIIEFYSNHNNKAITIWMAIVEKALAKIFGSYERLRQLKCNQILELLLGVPIITEIQTHDLKYFFDSKLAYDPSYLIYSSSNKFSQEVSQYFRITVKENKTRLGLAIWQYDLHLSNQQEFFGVSMVLELMKWKDEKEKEVNELCGYSDQLFDDKTILKPELEKQNILQKSRYGPDNMTLGSEFLFLEKGVYILHVYNRGDKDVHANIVVQSSKNIEVKFKNTLEELQNKKHQMAQKYYRDRHAILPRIQESHLIFLRFLWKGFRGTLCVKNENTTKIQLQIIIKEEYRNKIKFEDQKQFQIEKLFEKNEHGTVHFIRKENRNYGNFYSIVKG